MTAEKIQKIRVLEREPSLAQGGVAVSYFPCFKSDGGSQHTHDILEMVFVVSGEGLHTVGENSRRLSPGMLGIIHYGQSHSYLTGKKGLELYNIYLNLQSFALPDLGPQLNRVLAKTLPLHPELIHERNRVTHLNLKNVNMIINLLSGIEEETRRSAPGYETAVRLRLSLFLIECARHSLAESSQPDVTEKNCESPTGRLMEKVRVFLDANFRKNLPLATTADFAGLNPNYLCRSFKKHTGLTIVEYLNQRRVEAAMMALSASDDKILAIAFDNGFRDLAHFNRTFKKISGLAPGSYRKKMRKIY